MAPQWEGKKSRFRHDKVAYASDAGLWEDWSFLRDS